MFAYLALLGPGMGIGLVLFALMLLSVAASGALAVKLGVSGTPTVAGGRAGFGVALLNLIIIGSIAGRTSTGGLDYASLAIWGAGLIAGCTALGAIGGSLVRADRRGCYSHLDPTALFAVVASTLLFLLLITGGIVTAEESGLAVPDWPNSFGHNMILLPLAAMQQDRGVFYEHAHRLYGMFIGLTALALVVQTIRSRQPSMIRQLAFIALIIVIGQGVLGGLRVTGILTMSQDRATTAPSTGLAIVHGVLGQVAFGLFCVIAVATSQAWRTVTREIALRSTMSPWWTTVGFVIVVSQLVLGACYRHIQIVNPETGVPAGVKWAMHAHLGFALFAIAAIVIVGIQCLRGGGGVRSVRTTGIALHSLVLVQIVVGVLALVSVMMRSNDQIPRWEVAVTTAHQVTGAAIIGAMAVAVAWSIRFRQLKSTAT